MNNVKWEAFLSEEQNDNNNDNNNILNKNIKFLQQNYRWDYNYPNLPEIFSQYEVGSKLGAGSYGEVYELKNTSKVIKIYADAIYLGKDLKRYKTVIDQVFSGKADMEDMHYFEYGKITNILYYCVMPKIELLEDAPFWNLSDIFGQSITANKYALLTLQYKESKISYKEFKEIAAEKLFRRIREFSFSEDRKHKLLNDFKKYKKIVFKIFRAGYIAYLRHDGEDLHSGNIGYLPQKPDIFFYFDM